MTADVPRRALLLPLAIAAGLLVVAGIIGPVSATETRYCEMAREMLVTGDWVVPMFNGAPLLEKPPFEYWSTAAAMAALGVNDVAPHVPHLLAGALCLLVVAAMARRLAPEGAGSDAARTRGRLAALALGTMPSFVLQAYAVVLDVYLVLSVALAGWALLENDRLSAATGKTSWRWSLLLFAACGFGMLIKGPLTLALAFGAAAVTAIVRRRARILRPFASPVGWLAFAAITLPWYLALEHRLPGILEELVRRRLFGGLASSQDFHNRGWRPWVAWGPLVGAFPWLAALPAAIGALRKSGRWRDGPGLPLLALALSAPVLFTFSKTALASYGAPAYPFLALLVALGAPIGERDEMPADRRWRTDLVRAAVAMVVAAVAVKTVAFFSWRVPWPFVVAAGLMVVVALLIVAVLARTRRPTPAAASPASIAAPVAAVATLFLATAALVVTAVPERVGAARALWVALDSRRQPSEPVAAYLNYNGDFGLLPWYLRAEVPFFDYESKPMIVRPEEHRPDLFRPKADLVPWLKEPGRRWLMLRPRDVAGLKDQGVDLATVAKVGEYELVTTVPLDAPPRGPR